ncbi:MAG: TonB-dependent receptor, partial [Daejeonella sp.]
SGGVINNEPGVSHTSQYATSDRFFEDGSYIRLKTVTLSYNLPMSVLKHVKLRSVNVYLQGLNLWTLTKYTGIDPEFVNTTISATTGIVGTSSDFGQYPQGKNYTAGINIGF